MKTFTFKKAEHLCGPIAIHQLYEQGKGFIKYPIRLVYRKVDKDVVPIKVLIYAPKKRFKHAVDRNRYRRLLRECYRLGNQELKTFIAESDFSLHLAIVAVSNTLPEYEKLKPLVEEALSQIYTRLKENQEREKEESDTTHVDTLD